MPDNSSGAHSKNRRWVENIYDGFSLRTQHRSHPEGRENGAPDRLIGGYSRERAALPIPLVPRREAILARDEADSPSWRNRPETDVRYQCSIKAVAIMVSFLNLIYREFLKSAVPGIASPGGRR
jgi:hypothetical protein